MNKTTIVENQTKDNASGKTTKRIRDEKPRKKDEKSVDHVLRALDSLGTTEEKLAAMCQKYADMFNDHRMLQTAVKQAEKKNTLLQKEKEQLQAEHSKAILTRSRLENLCRELQRQNKAVKEECMLKMREEGEKKREVAAKFHSMLSEIGSLLAQNNDKNAKLRDDNLDMSMRLKSVCDQFEKKEQHVENLAKQMQLEMQLADAKLAKAKMEMDIEKETLQKEKQQLLIELADYKRKLVEMKASELALREQITMYSEKYEEFHKALLQSNSAIGEFKAEMERMTKHIRRLEKETATWKSRYDAAQRTLTEVTQGKIRSDEALGLAQRRLTALQGICRGLQDQCRQLRGETRRDSQTDEDYRKLEAQIKEVERESDLDTRPCPRSVSSERAAETISDDAVVQANNEFDEASDIHNSNLANKDLLTYEPKEVIETPRPDSIDCSDIHNSEVTEVSRVTDADRKELPDPVEGINISSDDESNTLEKDINMHNNSLAVENGNIEDTPQENSLVQNEAPDISTGSNIDIVSSQENEEVHSLENENLKDSLEHVENFTTLKSGDENSQSFEDSVNSLVNHIQEVSLLEVDSSNGDVVTDANEKIKEEENIVSTCEKVPNPSNSLNEDSLQPGVSLENNPEKNEFDFPNSQYCVMFGSVAGLNDDVTRKLLAKIDMSAPIKITDDVARNKKKRKTKK